MTTLEVGKKLVELCKQGKTQEVKETLYSQDICSVEAGAPAGQDRASYSLKAVEAKGKWWADNHIIHSAVTEGPWPHDDRFIVKFVYDVTNKPSNRRFTMDEMGLFTVQNGKIVKEEFFYSMG
ncbi:MAG: nuclear transport factor 2 family protein [Deltaproteobacteria bacterium]|nr:nuclear transport factor 2 family protein [Deltaproteobacteria bacterium]